jgi:2-hydroxy-6-oxonona-2,4-dienedioate hydrolase
MRMTHVNGHSIRYLDFNNPSLDSEFRQEKVERKVLVLLHGLGASAERWLYVSNMLSKDFRVVIPDIIGFGYSDKPAAEYTIDFFIDFFQGFLNNLNISRSLIVGSSFGGYLATEFAIRFNEQVEKLILAAPAGLMRTSTRVLDQYILAALYPTFENAKIAFNSMAYDPSTVSESTVRDFVNRMRLPNAKYAFMSTLLGIRDSPKLHGRLSKVHVPTLLVWGDNDNMIPLQYSNGFQEIPSSELVIINKCGHTPYVEKPQEFTDIALRFLKNTASPDLNRIE